MASEIVGGIEGGASNSTAVLMNPQGQVLAIAKGTGTNPYLIGIQECCKRISELVNQAKEKAGVPLAVPIGALGLSLSGCKLEKNRQELAKSLIVMYPNLAIRYAVSSDAEGSIATISKNGGVVCIAGTGSTTLLMNPNGETIQCGGWGHFLGDEGSAWSIAHNAVKYCLDDLDNFDKAPYPIDNVWNLIKHFYQLEIKSDILDVFYQNFDKSRIALMCKPLADLARKGDCLAQKIFLQAGENLAKSIASVECQASKQLTEQRGGLHIFCVGSVWLSWDLLQYGFTLYLKNRTSVDKLTLLTLKAELGVGAALMASDRLNMRLDRDYSKFYEVFFVYNKSKTGNDLL